MGIHLPVGGSTIDRTLSCPAWLRRAKTLKSPAGSNHAADLGNLLHDAMEAYYGEGKEFCEMVGELTFKDLTLKEEHLPILNQMREATEEALDTLDIDQFLCEPFVQLIPGVAGGSIDMLGISADGKTALCLDYKTGRGRVGVKDNGQLQFYLLSAMEDPKTAHLFTEVDTFFCAVVQPYVYGTRPELWECDAEALDDFRVLVDDAIDKTQSVHAPAVPGSHCRFCPYSPYCPEKRDQATSALLLDPKQAEDLDDAVALALQLKPWAEEVLQEATDKAQKGVRLAKHKLVAGRATRFWSDSQQAEHALRELFGDEAYTQKLVSPAQADKLLKAQGHDGDLLSPMIEKKEGNPSLVSRDDNRDELAAINATAILSEQLTKAKSTN